MKTDDGGQAFPGTTGNESSGVWLEHKGMTLRDYFAAAALAGLLAHDIESYESAVNDAYHYADAMLAARKE